MKIDCFGDSHTFSTVHAYYPLQLGELLGAAHTIVNKGVSADTTTQMLARFNADVLAQTPDKCVILGGYNDVNTGVALATIESNLQSMYDQCVANAITPIACLIYPAGSGAGWSQAKEDKRASLNDWIAGRGIAFVKDHLPGISRGDAAWPALSTVVDDGNGIHMNLVGARVVARSVYAAVGGTAYVAKEGVMRSSADVLALVPTAQVVSVGSSYNESGFLRLFDGRLVISEDASGTWQSGFLRTAAGELIVTQVATGAVMYEGYLRSPTDRLVVTTSATGAGWESGSYRSPTKALVVAGI